jgi:hypothetical protein
VDVLAYYGIDVITAPAVKQYASDEITETNEFFRVLEERLKNL